ncbi:MAG TPA: iron ABC transporter permease [Candidatus Limnocylindria bacterium]|nr:iron ABC transporter permease [Candidatus Limnocylindria bacterium]
MTFLVVFLAWPVGTVLARGLEGSAWEVLSRSSTRSIAWFTVWQAVVSTLLTLVAGLPIAYVLHRYRLPARRLLLAVVTVPFVLPTVVVGTAFRTVLPQEWIGTVTAIVIAHVFFNVAVVVRVVGGLWSRLDPRYDQAARSLGASPWYAFRTVTWPLVRPAVLAASALVFCFTFTSFGVVLVLGGPTHPTLEVEIYRRTAQLLDLPGAAAIAVVQLLAVATVLLVSARLQDRLAVRQRSRPAGEQLGPVRGLPAHALVAVVLAEIALIAVPMAALLVRSLRVGDGWGLAWWRVLFAAPVTTRDVDIVASVRTSLGYAAATAVVAVVIGGLAACAVAYSRRGGRALETWSMIPLGASAVTVGFGLLLAFSRPPLDLRGSVVLVPLGHALVAIPLVLAVTLPVLRALDPRLREVATTLGASPWRTWRTVDGRALAPALAVGAGLAAAVSLGEFGATAFLARTGEPTLPVVVVRLLGRPGEANVGTAAAAATLLMVVTAAIVLLADRWRTERAGTL